MPEIKSLSALKRYLKKGTRLWLTYTERGGPCRVARTVAGCTRAEIGMTRDNVNPDGQVVPSDEVIWLAWPKPSSRVVLDAKGFDIFYLTGEKALRYEYEEVP